ncbi:MAG TPA: hypothetical protein VN517_10940 [Terriglobales bacterium]|nr:hypothetical protein [Terriglobales bacterium]
MPVIVLLSRVSPLKFLPAIIGLWHQRAWRREDVRALGVFAELSSSDGGPESARIPVRVSWGPQGKWSKRQNA